MYRLRRSLSWLILVTLLLQIISPLTAVPAYAAPAHMPGHAQSNALGIAQTDSPQAIQVLFIYNNNTPDAQAVRTLLEANGAAVALRQLGEDTSAPPTPGLFVPAVTRGEGETSGAGLRIAQDENLDAYDVIVLGDDLEVEGALVLEPDLQQEILASQRPVIAMGRGGARFLQDADLLAELGLGNLATATQVNLCDSGAGAPLFQGENTLPLDQATYPLYDQGQPTVFAQMDARVPQTRRLACAEMSAAEVAILLLQGRFALWGFAGAPDQMTATGQALFANLLWLLAGKNVEIPLATGGLRPEPGIEQDLLDALQTGEAQYALVQFYRLPTAEEQKTLAELGIELLSYLTQNTYSARIRHDANLAHPLVEDLLRFAGLYKPEYKVSPALDSETGQTLENVLVIFFADVTQEAAIGVLQPIFGEAYSQGATSSEWYVPNDAEKLAALAASQLVRYIVPVVPPDELNENARPVVQTDDVHAVNIAGGSATYLGMSGQGVTLGIFEGRPLVDHGDMDGRIIVGAHASGSVSGHATHVSGIIMGNGAISAGQGLGAFQRRGHAPRAHLVTQASGVNPGSGSGFTDRFADSVINHNVFAHNHSYVQSYGDYDGTATTIDQVVRGDATSGGATIPPNLAIYAAGNNGQGAQYGNIVGFYSVFTTAKNSISVGSTDADTGAKSDFSSKGPTYDGRIKPDVVAPGCRDSDPAPSVGIMSPDTANGNTYGGKCGTSMAAPVVTGIAGLMQQQYRNTFGPAFDPRPSS
ncbi:MAG: S8 family serine peptidase, partial [Litorilinea sp.]